MPSFPKRRKIDFAKFDSSLVDREAKYGLPNSVTFCRRCVTSNQKPISAVEFQHKSDSFVSTATSPPARQFLGPRFTNEP